MNKRKTKSEFRYNYNTKHMNYVFEEDGNKFHSVGITHNKSTWDNKKKKRRKNMPLRQNPQKGKKARSFIRYGVIVDKKNNYSKRPSSGYRFSNGDLKNVKSKIRNYKNRRRNKK